MKKKMIDYTWNEFDEDLVTIAREIELNNIKTIVGIAKGGLPLAIKLANWMNVPLKIVTAESYKNKKKRTLCMEPFNCLMWKGPILLVDDICDTGETLKAVEDRLVLYKKEVISLTLFYKPHSIVAPTHCLHKVNSDVWVNMPWE